MSKNEEEEEIKIEYFESLDTDPLCENSEQLSCPTNDSVTSNICDENINQRNLNDDEIIENQETVVDDDKEYLLETDDEVTWYELADNLGRYLCKFCDNSYSKLVIKTHIKNKHFEEYNRLKSTTKGKLRRTKLKCHICKKLFKSINIMHEHMQIHDIQKSCLVCHTTFDKDTDLLNHMTIKHESLKRKLHCCFTCGYSTSKLSHFKQHEKTHSRDSQIKCSYCEYTTYHAPNMKIHERIHTNDKPYKCTFNGCDYHCASKSGLTSHLLKHEKEKNMIYCDQCCYSTVYRQSLKRHMNSHRRNSVKPMF